MKRLVACLLAALLPLTGFALTPAQAEAIRAQLTPFAPRVTQSSLVLTNEAGPAAVPVYVTPANCRIHASAALVAQWDEVTFSAAVAHELAHCALKHTHRLDWSLAPVHEQDAWRAEYDADLLGQAIARDAGLDVTVGFQHLFAGTQDGGTHPGGPARLAALAGAPRLFRELVRVSDAQAGGLHAENGVVSLR